MFAVPLRVFHARVSFVVFLIRKTFFFLLAILREGWLLVSFDFKIFFIVSELLVRKNSDSSVATLVVPLYFHLVLLIRDFRKEHGHH